MEEEISKIKENAINEIKIATNSRELDDVRVKYLGKKGETYSNTKRNGLTYT